MKDPSNQPIPKAVLSETLFVNEMRLGSAEWVAVVILVLLIMTLTPSIWKKVERFETGNDYRMPYSLSKDYWLYERRLQEINDPSKVILLGDSVIWGEYVLADGTLSHFLNAEAGRPERFVNGGVNGLFPLALEGLIRSYGGSLRHRKVVVQCNVLWMSSPKADLQVQKQEKFNHARLTPQFFPKIPCYVADAQERLGVVMERNSGFLSWISHLQSAYFDDKSILNWTLQESDDNPPRHPNSNKNPVAQITLRVPEAGSVDALRGPASSRHRAWDANAQNTVQFDWVDLETSLQWGAFQRLITLLHERGNEVLVVLGPFNEHMIEPTNRARFERIRDGIAAALKRQQVTLIAPQALPSGLYADASHPLTAGYELLAKTIYHAPAFTKWLGP